VINGSKDSFVACDSDAANKCYVKNTAISSAPNWKCLSGIDASLPYLCPGSFVKEVNECQSLSTADCAKAPNCIPRVDLIVRLLASLSLDFILINIL